MGFTHPLLCNSRISLIELSSRFIYSHSSYSVVSDMYAMISLYLYLIPCMIRGVNLVPWQRFRYSYVCSSMMSVHPGVGGSARDTRVSLINADVVSSLVSVAGCGSMPWLDEVGGRWCKPYPSNVTLPVRIVAVGGP
jgi:hypothetical protein